jgi:hypothetical protein
VALWEQCFRSYDHDVQKLLDDRKAFRTDGIDADGYNGIKRILLGMGCSSLSALGRVSGFYV